MRLNKPDVGEKTLHPAMHTDVKPRQGAVASVLRMRHPQKSSLRYLLAGASLIVWGCLGHAQVVLADPPVQLIAQLNQSDVSGTNVGDIVAPIVLDEDTVDGLDQAIITTAQQLSQDLEDAYAACQASQAGTSDTPRRFARGPATDEVCTSAECDRLNSLMQQARTFLNSLNDEDAAQVRRAVFQLW